MMPASSSSVDRGDAMLTVYRNAANDIQDRWLRLSVDGEFWEMLRYGQTLSRPVSTGLHILKAHNTLNRAALEFEAKAGEEIRVACSNTFAGGSFAMLLVMVLGVAPMRVRLTRDVSS